MEELQSMGFTENDARWALDASAGNIDTAIGLLLDDSGKSACTAIAISVMGVLLEKFSRDEEVHNENELTDAIFSGISNHSKFASDAACHMAVDELAPQLCASLEVVGESIQGLTTDRNAFKDLFEQARSRSNRNKPVGLVITKPPETLCIILPQRNNDKYALFDSHSRPQLGLDGAYLVTTTDERAVLQRLSELFPSFTEFLDDTNMMSMMYNMFEAAIFQLF